MTREANDSKLYCLLIGINYYLPNKLPNGLFYKSLWGCVPDIDRIQTLLQESFGVPDTQIIRLTSSLSPDGKTPVESPNAWPTYQNIVTAFATLTDQAKPGDRVYVHYSGHGGRTFTTDAFKPIKGEHGLDEVLVPMDLGNSEGHYLRDTELHYLIKRIVDKGLLLTLVLDSCHAGGATRSTTTIIDSEENEVGVRGVGIIDTLPRPQDSLVASVADLKAAWPKQSNTRNVESNAGWLLEPQGYTLIAACRSNEYANEIVFEGAEKNGALSYWLADSLKQIGPEFTYANLHKRLLAKVHGQFIEQTPQLQGEGDRVVLGLTSRRSHNSVPILRVIDDTTIVINAGAAHGVQHGTQFAIYPFSQRDLTNKSSRLAIAEVIRVEATESYATLSEKRLDIENDSQAVLLDAGSIKLCGKVRVVKRDESSAEESEALQRVADAIDEGQTTWISKLKGENEAADYLITTDGDSYIICDAAGVEVPNLRPALQLSDPEAPRRVVDRLSHLVKFINVQELDNNDPFSSITRKLSVDLVERPADFVSGVPVRLQEFKSLGHAITIGHHEWAFLWIKNNYSSALNISVLDLQPDWGISQVYPSRAASSEGLDPGQEIVLPMRVSLPGGLKAGRDTIKVFATLSTTDFRSLELPALDQPPVVNGQTRTATMDGLGKFLQNFSHVSGATRTVEIPVCATVEWCAHQVEIEISEKGLVSTTAG